MSKLISSTLPGLAEVTRLAESEEAPGQLGLFAKKDFSEGDLIYAWDTEDNPTVMEPSKGIAAKLMTDDLGALAFQLLKEARGTKPTPWKLWWATGVSAPKTHPLMLLTTDPGVVRELWGSTTCGSRMSALALKLRDDLETIGGDLDLQEWANVLALVSSRSLVTLPDSFRPLLVLGLDNLQDGEEANVEAFVEENEGFFGQGQSSKVVLKATSDIRAGEELITRYLPNPQAGRYIERFGFVPQRLKSELAAACAELTFEPLDEDDWNFSVKESLLEDLGIPNNPINFQFSTDQFIGPPTSDANQTAAWDDKPTMDKMVHILRVRCVDGADSFLADSVLIDKLWDNCANRISKTNESSVCRLVMAECDDWLQRFQDADDAEPEDDFSSPEVAELAKAAAQVRRAEADLLRRLKDIFAQELQDTITDENRKYWVDRRLNELFPAARGNASGGTGVDFIDN